MLIALRQEDDTLIIELRLTLFTNRNGRQTVLYCVYVLLNIEVIGSSDAV